MPTRPCKPVHPALTSVRITGRSSAWLERLVRDQEVGSSNLLAPIRHNTCRMLDLAYLSVSGSAALKTLEIR